MHPQPLGVFFSLPWAGAGIPGGWIIPSKRTKLQHTREQREGEIPEQCCLSAELCSAPASRGGEADGEAGTGRSCSLWLEDGAAGLHQLSQALTLHSLSHCCSFSPFSVSPLSKGTDQKNCAKVTGSQGCLSWSSCREQIRIRSNIPVGSALAAATPRKTAQK